MKSLEENKNIDTNTKQVLSRLEPTMFSKQEQAEVLQTANNHAPNPLGKHTLLELYDCPESHLSDPQMIQTFMEAAATAMGATIIESRFHHFSPLGVSGVVIIAESHLTIHTWPEYQYAAVDVFTCGDIEVDKGISLLKKDLQAQRVEIQVLSRGNFSPKS